MSNGNAFAQLQASQPYSPTVKTISTKQLSIPHAVSKCRISSLKIKTFCRNVNSVLVRESNQEPTHKAKQFGHVLSDIEFIM